MARGRRLPNFLKPSEIDQLLKTAQGCVDDARGPKRRKMAERNLFMLQAGLLLGMRVSEIAKLRVEHLDFETGMCLILLGKGGKDRSVPIPRRLMEPLKAFVGDRKEGPVFQNPRGGHISKRAIQKMCEDMGKKAGLLKRLKAHSLRHSFATRLLQTGADIMEIKELLGHSSVATTMVYLHTNPERLRGSVDRL